MKKLNKKGFTLVELLAVIVILALLMVVATRTIGGSLTESKQKAMQTEAAKIVSKTYEDLNLDKINGNDAGTTKTYNGALDTKGYSEGDYTVAILSDTTDTYKMIGVCISYGKSSKKYSYGTVNGSTITWDTDASYIDSIPTKCSSVFK